MEKHLRLLILGLLLIFVSCEKDSAQTNNQLKFQPFEFVELGGFDQAISVKGKDLSKPVLLILHGGPGYAMLPLFHMKLPELENNFIVVNWDQRGAGRSYSNEIPNPSMTLSQAISDAHELTEMLKTRFDKEKIYLLGHSWGSILGIQLVKDYPQDYAAYIGVGQVVNVIKNEQHSYDFALQQATNNKNALAINELKMIGAPNKDGEYLDDNGYDITNKWVEFYGGSLYGKTSSNEITDLFLNNDIYSEHVSQWRSGYDFSQKLFDDSKVWSFDFSETYVKLSLPVFFFTGRHDYETPSALVADYFNLLDAPEKDLVWFENSAHFPFYEEKKKFISELIRLIDP